MRSIQVSSCSRLAVLICESGNVLVLLIIALMVLLHSELLKLKLIKDSIPFHKIGYAFFGCCGGFVAGDFFQFAGVGVGVRHIAGLQGQVFDGFFAQGLFDGR